MCKNSTTCGLLFQFGLPPSWQAVDMTQDEIVVESTGILHDQLYINEKQWSPALRKSHWQCKRKRNDSLLWSITQWIGHYGNRWSDFSRRAPIYQSGPHIHLLLTNFSNAACGPGQPVNFLSAILLKCRLFNNGLYIKPLLSKPTILTSFFLHIFSCFMHVAVIIPLDSYL